MPRSRRLPALALLALGLAAAVVATPGPEPSPDAAELLLDLERLSVLGSALYVAAHPDDENTALLAYLARGRHVRTAYLSLTRGDGGQNLIGSEQGELLGMVRTQELLAARRLDGGEQFFTRAVDFGYTKSAEETLEVWGREAVLADVVRVLRTFRPDVLVTRFPLDGRGGHGQHTASALLAVEGFHAAADPGRFPEQLADLAPWAARRVLWNAWRPDEGTERPAALVLDLGAFSPILGRSFTEVAALSRSMHKSQGFGSSPTRGTRPDGFDPLAGDPAASDLLEGVNLGWSRVAGGEAVEAALRAARESFLPERPAAVLPFLARALEALDRLPADPWMERKREELARVMRGASGVWLEAVAPVPWVAPGEELEVRATVVDRAGAGVVLEGVTLPFESSSRLANETLATNEPRSSEGRVRVPPDQPLTQPHWLVEPPDRGLYRVSEPRLGIQPQAPSPLRARFSLRIAGVPLVFEEEVVHRWTDPVAGERYRRVEVVPRVALDLDGEVFVFADERPRSLRLVVRAGAEGTAGGVSLAAPRGWRATPRRVPFGPLAAGGEEAISFELSPPERAGGGTLVAAAEVDGVLYGRGWRTLEHDHLPVQTYFPPAEARLTRLELARGGARVGYVLGAGDEVPEALRQVGYEVDLLSDDQLATGDLSVYDAVVTGVRAYNTRPRLAHLNGRLLDYVASGGVLVVQYSTAHDLVREDLGPFPFQISRERVTREDAPMIVLDPAHPLLSTPNRIDAADFEGWVQERGLYFADTWDPRFEAPLAASDPGEAPLAGGLLYGRHGEGAYVYTGLSFFRQLPAGVPGAFRLFANLLAGGLGG